jgi:transcriptional antiterminator NusG
MSEQSAPKWYVLQTLSGHENKVQERILREREQQNLHDAICQVEVPTETVAEVRRGKKTKTSRKFFPGYILIQMRLYKEDGSVDQAAYYLLRETEGVIGFAGGGKPVPLRDSEVDRILAQTTQGDEEHKPKMDFKVGEVVVIQEGAFANFEGQIESVDPERSKLQLSVSIFGRSTPVEVECWQVEKVQ